MIIFISSFTYESKNEYDEHYSFIKYLLSHIFYDKMIFFKYFKRATMILSDLKMNTNDTEYRCFA